MTRLIICTNFRPFAGEPSCANRGSKQLADLIERTVKSRGLDITLKRSVCLGHCPVGPNLRVAGGDFIHHATELKVMSLLDSLTPDDAPDAPDATDATN
jgi:NADH:ubiquinone oxidoreductase subunit E